MTDQELKAVVHERCLDLVESRLTEIRDELKRLQEAANEETKSSAGDKYETGRAMLMLEREKLGGQLQSNEAMLTALARIDLSKSMEEVDFGSLVRTKTRYTTCQWVSARWIPMVRRYLSSRRHPP